MKNLTAVFFAAPILFAHSVAGAAAVGVTIPFAPTPVLRPPFARPVPPRRIINSDWDCHESVQGRDGALFEGCRNPTPWACYENIEKRCVEMNTGRVYVNHYRKLTGRCGTNLSECW